MGANYNTRVVILVIKDYIQNTLLTDVRYINLAVYTLSIHVIVWLHVGSDHFYVHYGNGYFMIIIILHINL